jgi:hypothetical protein
MAWFLVQGIAMSDAPRPDNTLPGPQPPWPSRPPIGPVDPGYSPPWAQVPGGGGGGGPVDPGYSPPWAQVPPGGPPRPGHDLPLFPSHWPVVPPGGAWPSPPGQPPRPGHDLPLFPTNLPVVPPGGSWPKPPEGTPDPFPDWDVKTAWSASTGWIVVLVPTGDQLVPTPSE